MAGLVHVTAVRDFYDERERVSRKEGESFDVTKSRLKELNACGLKQCYEPLVAVEQENDREADGE